VKQDLPQVRRKQRRAWTLMETMSVVGVIGTLCTIAYPHYAGMPMQYRSYHVPTQAELNELEARRVAVCAITQRNLNWLRAHPGQHLPLSLEPINSIRRQRIELMEAMAHERSQTQPPTAEDESRV
jgi:hypothetical protein